MPTRFDASRRKGRQTVHRGPQIVFLALLLGVLSYSAGCASTGSAGPAPECPYMPVEAEDDLRRLIDSGEYEALHNWHGTMVVYCEAIECWNDPAKCQNEKQQKSPLWRRFMACAFSLECG